MSKEYNEYLDAHISAVKQATEWMCDNLDVVRGLGEVGIAMFRMAAIRHDESKWHETEYGPYDAYFYGERDEDAFNHAWLLHIHRNPHHWQHWLLVNDDGKYRDQDKVIPLEMSMVCALEMIADWWSFSWRSGNLYEVFDWYKEHKDNIILHPKTREFVESVLDEIKERVGGE